MLKKLFRKTNNQTINIYAPLNGKVVPLAEVPDPVFSEKMMGDGVAIIPNEGKVVSPIEGKIVHVADTKHAVGLEGADGTELLIHVGLETVALKGEGFQVSVSTGDKVSVGDELIEFDLDFIKNNVKSIVTPVVITNANQTGFHYSHTDSEIGIAAETVVITRLDN